MRRAGWVRRPPGWAKAVIFLLAITAYSTAGFVFFEMDIKPETQWPDALWWALVTMTTVGFGDYFPSSPGGRFFVGIPAMLVGMGMLSYVLSQIAAFFLRAEILNRKGLAVPKAENHILVLNFPRKARFSRIITKLRAQPEVGNTRILLIDEELDELDDELAALNVRYVRGHPARSATLERAEVVSASRAIVLARDATKAHSDDLTVAACLMLKQMKPELHVVAECVDPENRELLERAGCQSVVCVLDLAPGILVQELHDPGVVEVLQELTVWQEEINNIYIVTIDTVGKKNVHDLRHWSTSNNATLLGIRQRDGISLNPDPAIELNQGDAAIIIRRCRPEAIRL